MISYETTELSTKSGALLVPACPGGKTGGGMTGDVGFWSQCNERGGPLWEGQGLPLGVVPTRLGAR